MQQLRRSCSNPVDAVQTLEKNLITNREHAFEIVRHAKPDTAYPTGLYGHWHKAGTETILGEFQKDEFRSKDGEKYPIIWQKAEGGMSLILKELTGNFDQEHGYIFWSNNEIWQRKSILQSNTEFNLGNTFQSSSGFSHNLGNGHALESHGCRSIEPVAESGYEEDSNSPDLMIENDYMGNRRNNRSRPSHDFSHDSPDVNQNLLDFNNSVSAKREQWQCPTCTFINNSSASICTMCHMGKRPINIEDAIFEPIDWRQTLGTWRTIEINESVKEGGYFPTEYTFYFVDDKKTLCYKQCTQEGEIAVGTVQKKRVDGKVNYVVLISNNGKNKGNLLFRPDGHHMISKWYSANGTSEQRAYRMNGWYQIEHACEYQLGEQILDLIKGDRIYVTTSPTEEIVDFSRVERHGQMRKFSNRCGKLKLIKSDIPVAFAVESSYGFRLNDGKYGLQVWARLTEELKLEVRVDSDTILVDELKLNSFMKGFWNPTKLTWMKIQQPFLFHTILDRLKRLASSTIDVKVIEDDKPIDMDEMAPSVVPRDHRVQLSDRKDIIMDVVGSYLLDQVEIQPGLNLTNTEPSGSPEPPQTLPPLIARGEMIMQTDYGDQLARSLERVLIPYGYDYAPQRQWLTIQILDFAMLLTDIRQSAFTELDEFTTVLSGVDARTFSKHVNKGESKLSQGLDQVVLSSAGSAEISLRNLKIKTWEKIRFPSDLNRLDLDHCNFSGDLSYLYNLRVLRLDHHTFPASAAPLIFPPNIEILSIAGLGKAFDLSHLKKLKKIEMVDADFQILAETTFPSSMTRLNISSSGRGASEERVNLGLAASDISFKYKISDSVPGVPDVSFFASPDGGIRLSLLDEIEHMEMIEL